MGQIVGPIPLEDWRTMAMLLRSIKETPKRGKYLKYVDWGKAAYSEYKEEYCA